MENNRIWTAGENPGAAERTDVKNFLDELTPAPGRAGADLEALRASGFPIVLYGDGWYAPYVREYLARSGLSPAACFADDGCAASAGTVSFGEIERRFERFNVVIAFANSRLAEEKLRRKDSGRLAGVYSFDVIGTLLDYKLDRAYLERHEESFRRVHGMLGDELSRKTYAAFLGAKLGGGAGPLYEVLRKDQYFPEDIIKLSDREVFVDGGAYTGDTLLTFIRKAGNKYGRCYAFEPEPENISKLKELAGRQRFRAVSVIGKGLWSKADTLRFTASEGPAGSAISETGAVSIETEAIDNAAPDATYIKLDVEGAELEALKGAAGTIKKNRPKLAVCLYHKPGDLFEIPLFIKSLVPEYRLFLRQHQPVSCELVLYAVL
ncbi:MAG: FkbM family methyltransferase [Elusimicrobia bacterium]|nr:FkbM family methyltransferase [Elusimicrobiota bacterium]